jgi:BASS family bile acid:Na+ symporter
MDVAALAKQVFPLAALTIPFAVGLQATPAAAVFLVRAWRLGLRAFVAMFVVMPALTVVGLYVVRQAPPVNAALLTLSCAPMLPALHFLLQRVGAETRYRVGLEVAAALASLVVLPVVFWIVTRIAPVVVHVDLAKMIGTLLKGLFLPLAAGMVVNVVTSGRTERFGVVLVNVATAVFIACGLTLMWTKRDLIAAQLHWPAFVAIALFVLVGLATGHALGGPHPGNRATLALATSGRHVGLALAIVASLLGPDLFLPTAATILIYALARPLIALPYVRRAMALHAAAT